MTLFLYLIEVTIRAQQNWTQQTRSTEVRPMRNVRGKTCCSLRRHPVRLPDTDSQTGNWSDGQTGEKGGSDAAIPSVSHIRIKEQEAGEQLKKGGR